MGKPPNGSPIFLFWLLGAANGIHDVFMYLSEVSAFGTKRR